jgi:peptide/nickel transport system permease protein
LGRYLTTRIVHSLVVILAVSAVVFMLSHLSGDPAALLLPRDANRAQLEQFYRDIGYDQPLPLQFIRFLGALLHGDLGVSLFTKEPALNIVLERLPATLELAGAALLISIVVSFPVGVYAATHPYSIADRVLLGVTVLAQSMPIFWLGLMLIALFGVQLHWLPVAGRGGLDHLILPAVALSLYSLSRNARIIRSSMLDTLGTEYIRTARAKGLDERTVVWRHALKNALIPVVTILGLQIGSLVGGVVVTETVFAWPGVGRLIVQAITSRDFPLVQASVLFLSTLFVTINIVVDLTYALIDPRISITH